MKTDKVILGIDPGTNIMGYSLIHIVEKKINILTFGVLNLSKFDDHHLKLQKIFERTIGLIDEYKPDDLAIEAPFFGKNVQSMLKLGRAQGVAIAAAISRSVPAFEYSPRKIKQSITGKGSASKEQVAYMLQHMLKIKEMPEFLDATDALGVAVCHYFQNTGGGEQKKSYTGWKAFVTDNPEKVKKS